jgi:methionyl aminopeptidase
MIILKSERDIEAMRVSGAMAAEILNLVGSWIRPGVTTREIDQYAAQLIKERGAKSAFLGYRKYPCHICISVNDQIVHGLAGDRRVEFGDIVSLDVGVVYNGFIGDTARTVPVGGCSVEAQRLMDVTERSLFEGIAQAVPGKRVVDISRAIQKYVEGNGFSVVREFVGHGLGRRFHQEPSIPHFPTRASQKVRLEPGMCFTVEPSIFIPHQLGCRVEDIVVVGESGGEPLTSGFQQLQVVE